MKKLNVDLTFCYGIRELKADFDFSGQSKAYAIYAPNGAMKTSFAKALDDVARDADSQDRIFPDRKCSRTITDENGDKLPAGSVFVVSPYDEVFGHTEKTSLLLVNERLRKEYDKLNEAIIAAEKPFIAAMAEQSKSKKDLKREIASTFTKSADQFYVAITRVVGEVEDQGGAPWSDIEYDKIFDDKVLAALDNKDVRASIGDYVARLNELLDASTYFKKNVFSYYNASAIAKSLAEHGFFDAKHTVRLNATQTIEITSKQQLEDLINKEKEGIATDAGLRKRFDAVAKQLEKNVQCRDFVKYLTDRQEILPHLNNVDGLKEEIWKSYFKARLETYKDLVDKYQTSQKRRKEIEAQAAKERTQWESVIEIFNDRFVVPFTLDIKNRIAVAIGSDKSLVLGYIFKDGADGANIDRDTLLQVLSTGEKKALYILNIIFEVEVRRETQTETLFVFDDIADSFDYRNKYAIIQYMHDIASTEFFRQIILTHNFDFFRTVHLRFVPYPHCRMAFKDSKGLTFIQATAINNVFVNDWKKNYFTDLKKKLASIPFIRNIVEYTKGVEDPDYGLLTSLLHWKTASAAITISDLDDVFSRLFPGTAPASTTIDGNGSVIDAMKQEATKCLTAGGGLNLDNKVLLAMAIRIVAEQFMVSKINDQSFVDGITANQTQALLARFRGQFPGEHQAIRTLQNVVIMTPENIHLNSFMYEPILDMSDEHLRKLYGEVAALEAGGAAVPATQN